MEAHLLKGSSLGQSGTHALMIPHPKSSPNPKSTESNPKPKAHKPVCDTHQDPGTEPMRFRVCGDNSLSCDGNVQGLKLEGRM